jgi:phosphoglycolate phosphatase-like HAD superfamily hydrolase
MKDEFSAAVLMGRTLDLLRRAPETTADHKAAVKGLLELAARRSLTVRLDQGTVSVEGVAVPSDTPFVAVLVSQMQAHGLAEIHIGHQATAVDLVHLLQALSPDLMAAGPDYSVEQRLREGKVATVSVVSSYVAEAVKDRRRIRVTEALASVGVAGPPPAPEQLRAVSAASGASRDATLEQQLAQATMLSPLIAALDDTAPLPVLQRQLDSIQASITKAFDQNRMEQAIDGLAALVRRDTQASNEQVKRAYAVPLRWLLIERHMAQVVPYLLDDLYQADALAILRRAGKDGTRVVVQHLADAPTFAERRTLLKAVRQLEEGVDVIANMLGHHQWFVVRNMADLAGDLKIVEAVDPLRRAIEHADTRVRKAAGVALAKIGTQGAAWGVVKVLRDPDQEIRLAVAREIYGEGMSGVVPTLSAAAETEEHPDTLHEYYRALGRIGTPAAVQMLVKFAEPGGKFMGRRPLAPRVAAVEGLALARGGGGNAARSALQALSSDSTKEVRDAARRALEG